MRRLLTVTALGGALLLTGCASDAPTADLDDAREWVEGVVAEASDGPGDAGSATLLVPVSTADEPGAAVTLTYPAEAAPTLTRAEVRCHGGGTVEVTVTLTPPDGGSPVSHDDEISCDEAVHEIDLEGAVASSAVIEASTDAATYAYVLLIQGLTVSFD